MKIQNTFDETDPIMDEFVEMQMDILDRVHILMRKKFNGSQRELAEAMGVTEANVSKMVNGLQNFKLFTLVKLGHALGEELIQVPCDESHEEVSVSYVIDRKDNYQSLKITFDPKAQESALKMNNYLNQPIEH